jgi:hypothetical protein
MNDEILPLLKLHEYFHEVGEEALGKPRASPGSRIMPPAPSFTGKRTPWGSLQNPINRHIQQAFRNRRG